MAERSAPQEHDQSEKDFLAGFEDEGAAAKTVTKPGDQKPDESAAAPKVEPEKKVEPAKPKAGEEHVTLTREQFDKFVKAADETAAIRTEMSKAFGTFGNTIQNMQQLVQKLQSATPAGAVIELPKDVVADLEKDFPELAAHVRSALEKAFKAGVRGTGTASGLDQDAVTKTFNDRALARDLEVLEEVYPDWKQIVGAVADGKYDPKHPFRAWLATQSEEYQQKINNTEHPAVIERAITRFKAYEADQKAKAAKKPVVTKKPDPQAAARRDNLRAAVQPKGAGPTPARARTAADDFRSGFES